MRRTFRVAAAAAGLAGGLALAAGACTFADDPTAAGTAADPATTLTVANPIPVVSLDPHGAQSADMPTLTVAGEVFEPLVRRVGGSYRPWLAASWRVSDGTTWTFRLRKGVSFADGTPLTSGDVKASLNRLIAAKGPLAGLWESLDRIETPDDGTVAIVTRTPVGPMLSNISMLAVAPAGALGRKDFFARPYGTGPYRTTGFVSGQSVTLERNPHYWGTPPAMRYLRYRYIPELSSRLTALQNGEADFTWGVPPDQVTELKDERSLRTTTYPTYSNYYLWFNAQRKPFTDVRVRRAMWHAVDMKAIRKALFGDQASVATSPLPDAVFGSAARTPYEYDPAKARRLLAEAGYPDGLTTTMMWSSGCCTSINPFAETLISYWAKVGIKVRPAELERATWLDRLLKLDWDSTLTDGNTITGDADFTLARLYLSTAGRTGYADPALDRLLLAARAEPDQRERAALYDRAAKIIWDQAVGIFPLDLRVTAVYRDGITGFQPAPDALPRFDTVRRRQA